MPEFDVIVIGAGPAGENAAGRDRGRGPVDGDRRAGADRWRMLLLGLHSEQDAAAPWGRDRRRPPGSGSGRGGDRTIDVQAALDRRDYMTSSWDDSGQVPWLDDNHITLLRGTARLTGPRTMEVTDPAAPSRR